MKAPAGPEIRELVIALSDLAEQNLREEGGWFYDGFCSSNQTAIKTLIDYGLWKLHPESHINDSELGAKWCGWNESSSYPTEV